MSGTRIRIFKVFAVLLSGVTCLLILEGATRFLVEDSLEAQVIRATDFNQVYFKPDSKVGIVRRSNLNLRFRFPDRPSGSIHFITNNLGLRRSAPTEIKKPEGVKRILVLGDSHLDGAVDNEENFSTLLERDLDRGAGAVEVLNAATGSYSPYQSFLWLKEYGVRLQPDVVIFGIYIGNDLAELIGSDRPRLVKSSDGWQEKTADSSLIAGMNISEERNWKTRVQSFLIQNSALFNLVVARMKSSGLVAAGPVAAAYKVCLGCTAQSLGQIHLFKGGSSWTEAVDNVGEILRITREMGSEAGFETVVLPVPTRLQVEPEIDRRRVRQVFEILGLAPVDVELEGRIYGGVLAEAKEAGLLAVDLLPVFVNERVRTGEPLYYDLDWHINSRAHWILASHLLTVLSANLDL